MQVKFIGEFKLQRNYNQCLSKFFVDTCNWHDFRLVHASYSLPFGQAVKLIFFARAVIKRWGPRISPSYYERGPRLLSKEYRRKIELIETPSCMISHWSTCCIYPATWDLGDNPALHSVMEFTVIWCCFSQPYHTDQLTYVWASGIFVQYFPYLRSSSLYRRKNSLIVNCKCT